jgi:transketolase
VRNAFTQTMSEVGVQDPDLCVLVGDISHFALQDFAQKCPGRFYNVGILEPTIISMAAGLSHAGLIPVVHTITPFIIERGFEQIKLDFCYQERGGNLISVGSAFDYSGLGCSHFCYDDIALIKALPGTEIVYPAEPEEFRILFKLLYNNGRLTYFRLPGEKHGIKLPAEQIQTQKAILVKPGKDITVVAAGPQLKTVMDSIPLLEKAGIDVEVIYPVMIKPFDYASVRTSIRKTQKYIVLEEHARFGGIGDEVRRALDGLPEISSCHIGIGDRFIHGYGSREDHCRAVGLTIENLVAQAQKLMKNQGGQRS